MMLSALRSVFLCSSTIEAYISSSALWLIFSCFLDYVRHLESDYGLRLDFAPLLTLYIYNSGPCVAWSRIPRATRCLSEAKWRPSGSSSDFGWPLSVIKAYKKVTRTEIRSLKSFLICGHNIIINTAKNWNLSYYHIESQCLYWEKRFFMNNYSYICLIHVS